MISEFIEFVGHFSSSVSAWEFGKIAFRKIAVSSHLNQVYCYFLNLIAMSLADRITSNLIETLVFQILM